MRDGEHLKVLDGWRGMSILFVLVAHIVPLPFGEKTMELMAHKVNQLAPGFFATVPKAWEVNDSIGILGMVLFFNLSGFLITSFLLRSGATVPDFLIRRFFRIVPLVWLYLAIVLPFSGADLGTWAANYLFYANLPPPQLLPLTGHLWSLCVEVQFYLSVALIFGVLGARGLLLLPLLAAFFTLLRVVCQIQSSSITYFRIDEILAGCTLALVLHGRLGSTGEWIKRQMRSIPRWLLVPLLVASCFSQSGWLNFARPYLAALLIGSTVLNPEIAMARWLQCRPLVYLAGISYALYVWHLGLTGTWLWTGDVVTRMLKRPLFLVVLFIVAHVSTYYFEQRWIALGKQLASWRKPAPT